MLNPFLALGRPAWSASARPTAPSCWRTGAPSTDRTLAALLVALADVEPLLPVAIGDYVDFYSSLEHASRVGQIFRPDAEPLLPNWRRLPVGYHGRAGTVVVGGTPVRRPRGSSAAADEFGPEPWLDFEAELGFVTGPGPALGTPVAAADAAEHIFGFVLVNDWSSRRIQFFEYQPLGPFLGKSFATSISPWIVPLDALAPHRVAGPPQEPEPSAYLRTEEPWALDVAIDVEINGSLVWRTNARGLYWNAAQQLAHATANGATIAAGDLFASGTISGAEPGTYGCLLELSWGGRDAIALDDGRPGPSSRTATPS